MTDEPAWPCPYCRAKPNEPCWEGKRSRPVRPHRARLHAPKTRWHNSTPNPVDKQSRQAIDVLPKNVWSRIEFADHCWTWRGGANGEGYGSVCHEGRTWSTHRLTYELLVGPIPAGLQIDHLCLNKLCCRPAHLEPVTPKQNVNRYQMARVDRRRLSYNADPTYIPARAT